MEHLEIVCDTPKHPGSPVVPFMHVLFLMRLPNPQVTEQEEYGPQGLQPDKYQKKMLQIIVITKIIIAIMQTHFTVDHESNIVSPAQLKCGLMDTNFSC